MVGIVRGGAGGSFVRHTSRCRWTESIVSLGRGVSSCAELQVFSYYRGWKEACHATRTISTTSRRHLSSRVFFMHGKAPKEMHAILKETLEEHAPLYATVKNLVDQFKRRDFHSDHPGDYWSNSRANLGRPPDFGWINSWATGHLTWEGWVQHSWRFRHAEALREVGPEMLGRGSKTSNVPVVWANSGIFFGAIQMMSCRDWWLWTKPGYITMTRRQSNN